MRYTGGDFYSLAMDIIDSQYACVLDVAEQLMNTDTNEALVKNIQIFYDSIGWRFLNLGDDAQNKAESLRAVTADEPGLLLDKMLELGYRMHKDKWHKRGIGYYVPQWTRQTVLEDDISFEQYLNSLK